MTHNIVFNTWNGAFFHPGGGEVQLLNSKKYLENKGYNITLFDLWSPNLDADILHQFSIQSGVEHVIDAYKSRNKKIAISPIFWAQMEPNNPYYLPIKNVLEKADILFSNSDMESENLSTCFKIPLEKFHKTRNSITDDYLHLNTSENFRERFQIQDDFILSVANIETRKNLHSLIMAAEKIKMPIVSIGHIKDDEYFNTFLSHSLYFKHVGPIQDIELLKSAYQQCSLFAMPSICETPGIAALEAASQGAKILITAEGSTKEYFGDFVTYVNPFSPEDIYQGIKSTLNKDGTPLLINNITKNFTWDKTADDIIAGYLKILNS
jgi:glycosyltransferase involved in cell wall biosynthesis